MGRYVRLTQPSTALLFDLRIADNRRRVEQNYRTRIKESLEEMQVCAFILEWGYD